jgi:hypothetical protein
VPNEGATIEEWIPEPHKRNFKSNATLNDRLSHTVMVKHFSAPGGLNPG